MKIKADEHRGGSKTITTFGLSHTSKAEPGTAAKNIRLQRRQTMKLFQILAIALMFFMILISAEVVFAHKGNGPPPPPVGSGLCTDGEYLFVMAGDTLFQYSVDELSLVTTVALPKPDQTTGNNNQIQSSKFVERWAEKIKNLRNKVSSDSQTTPAPPPAGSGICTDGPHLFMLRGDTLYQYTTSNMTLVKSVELPKPEAPTAE